MKKSYLLIVPIFLSALIVIMIGCEYDAPTAMYYEEQSVTNNPIITSIDPPEAAAGVNYITIIGENFADSTKDNRVYFNVSQVEIIDNSPTAIRVRRPNQSGDAITVRVINQKAVEVAEYGPYKITTVFRSSGLFPLGETLTVIEVDDSENLYIAQIQPTLVYKITSAQEKTVIAEPSRPVTDMKMAPDGKLVVLTPTDVSRVIKKMDVETGEMTDWAAFSKGMGYGDFDSNGIFYTGGNKTDLMVVSPDGTGAPIDVYDRDKILGIAVHNDYVYVLADLRNPDEQNPELAFWKHQILDSGGSLGSRELVLDWANTGEFAAAEAEPKNFIFDEDGIMYVATDYTDPIFMLHPDGTQDILFKAILPTYSERIVLGNQGTLYMLLGGELHDLLYVDMGTTSTTR